MTVSSTTNRKTFAGNGATTSFGTSPVVFFDTSDLVLTVVTDATGASETLVKNTDYTVTGGAGTTGTVDLTGGTSPYGAPATGTTLVIRRVLPLTQDDDFLNNDINDAEVLEDRLDKQIMVDQQLDEENERSLKLSSGETGTAALTELPFDRANRVLAFDSSKNLIAQATVPTSGVLATAFMETLLDDTTAAAARTTLGLDAIRFGNGAYTPGVSGTDLGVDTINAKGFYNNGSSNRILPIIIATASTPAAQTTVDKSVSSTINGLAVQYNRVVVMGRSISTNGTSPLIVQLSGISGTPETSGYVSAATELRSAAGTLSGGTSTAGFLIIPAPAAASSYSFTLLLSRVTGNTWSGKLSGNDETNGYTYTGHGTIALPNAILTVRLTTAGGADLFDVAGSFNITYE